MGMPEFGKLIRDARTAHRLNGADLAPKVGMSPSMLSDFELGKKANPPTPEMLSGLSRELGISQRVMLSRMGYDVDEDDAVAPIMAHPREQAIERLRSLHWTEGVNRSMNITLSILEDEQGITRPTE